MMDNNPAGLNEKKAAAKKKRIIIGVVCVVLLAAAIVCAVFVSKSSIAPEPEVPEGGHTETDEAGQIVTDFNGDPVYFDDNGDVVTTAPAKDTADTSDPDDEPDLPFPETSQLVTAGTDKGKWPEKELPSDVPAFDDYLEIYNAKYTLEDGEETWFIFWNSTSTEFNDWMQKLIAKGFVQDERIINLYSNGSYVLNIETQVHGDSEIDVSIDVNKAAEPDYPETVSRIFPAFTADATLYFTFEDDDGTNDYYTMNYVCAKDWNLDLVKYKEALTNAGFTIGEDSATKKVAGKTYEVFWGGEKCLSSYKLIVFSY